MKTIKIPTSIELYFFFTLMSIIISLLGLDYYYGLKGLDSIFFTGIIGLIISGIHSILLFNYFKNPKKYSNIIISIIIFFILLYLISIKYSGFYIIPLLYNLYFLYKFIQFKKILNDDEKNEELKDETKNTISNIKNNRIILYIKYILFIIYQLIVFLFISALIAGFYSDTNHYNLFIVAVILLVLFIFQFKYILKKIKINGNYETKKDLNKKRSEIEYISKNQYKSVFIVYGVIILLLMIFYFVQYNKVINFKHIDDSYFDIPEKYQDVSKKENGYQALKNYLKHLNELDFVEDKEFRKTIFQTGVIISNLDLNIDRVKEIDNLRLGIDNIINKKVIVKNFNGENISLQGLSMMTKESLYNTLYYLEKGEEQKAIKYLINNYKFSKLMISSYSNLINFIVGITINDITLSDLEFIIDNYKLKNSTLIYIKNSFKNSINIKSSFQNITNYEYYSALNLLKNTLDIHGSLIFSSKNYYKEGMKNVYYGISQMYNDMKLDSNGYYIEGVNTNTFDLSDEYICSEKNINKLRGSGLPKLFFRKNTASNIFLVNHCISSQSYKPELENILIKEKKILEKIEKILKKEELLKKYFNNS